MYIVIHGPIATTQRSNIMSTKPKVINGLSFDISQPYEAGHSITDLEARVLNQTRAENIGNNVRTKIKEMQDANADTAAIVAMVTDFDAGYEFRSVSESAGRSVDPTETEARKIAKELLKNHLAASGRKLTVAPEGETEESWKDKVAAKVDEIASSDAVLKAAAKNVAAKKKTAESLLEAIGGIDA